MEALSPEKGKKITPSLEEISQGEKQLYAEELQGKLSFQDEAASVNILQAEVIKTRKTTF